MATKKKLNIQPYHPMYFTVRGRVDSEAEAIKEVYEKDVPNLEGMIEGRMPICVRTEYAPNMYSYGVQFWSEEQIKKRVLENTDKTKSVYMPNHE